VDARTASSARLIGATDTVSHQHDPESHAPLIAAFVGVVFLFVAAPGSPQSADANGNDALTMFLDCMKGCDSDYIRTELTIVNYVRDPADADVDVLVTLRSTGSGGVEYTVRFIGQRRFDGVEQTLVQVSPETATDVERRKDVLQTLKRGLVRYLSDTAMADRLSVEFLPAPAVRSRVSGGDPWQLWVFRLDVGGSATGERSSSGASVRMSATANRTSEDWKVTVFTSGTYQRDTFALGQGDTFTALTRTLEVSTLAVRTINPHWSLGMVGRADSSTYLNFDMRARLAPGIEYNVFPYAESTRRMLTVEYTFGVNDLRYRETTILDKLAERLADHRLAVGFTMQQPWGSGFAEMAASKFIGQPRSNVAAMGNANIRLVRGLSLSIAANATRTGDQRYLPREGATTEQILARQQQLATTYRYSVTLGIGYAFGSIFNNVVNPRFGGGGGDLIF
jgi:hypothetical protein